MGKKLIIKDADFRTNGIKTVTPPPSVVIEAMDEYNNGFYSINVNNGSSNFYFYQNSGWDYPITYINRLILYPNCEYVIHNLRLVTGSLNTYNMIISDYNNFMYSAILHNSRNGIRLVINGFDEITPMLSTNYSTTPNTCTFVFRTTGELANAKYLYSCVRILETTEYILTSDHVSISVLE